MNLRKTKLVRLDMQLKVVFISLFVTCFTLLIFFQISLSGLWSLSSKLPSSTSAEVALEQARGLFIHNFGLSLVISVPLAVSVGVIYSFKFSGPIYRFKKHFTDLCAGRWDRPVSLRDGDDLRDVSDAINSGLDLFRGRMQAHYVLLKDLESFFEDAGFTADGHSQDRLRHLRDRIAAERAAHVERFPAALEASKPQQAPELAGGALS